MTWNSAQSFQDGNDSLGFPQFQGADSYFLVTNGLIIQGGKATAPGTGNFDLPFPAAFTKQLLTVQVVRIDVANHIYVVSAGTNLEKLRVHLTASGGSFYWQAVGV